MINQLLLQAGGGSPFMSGQFLFLLGMVAVFYFFIIRPNQKKQKEQKRFLTEIKKGDDVVTIGGMHGKVYSVEDDLVVLDVDKGTKLTFNKSALSVESSKSTKK